jgi:hypothetical protein
LVNDPAVDDDRGGDQNALIDRLTLRQSGYYKLVVKSRDAATTGPYSISLSLETNGGDPPEQPSTDVRVISLPDIPVLKPGQSVDMPIVVQNTSTASWPGNGTITLININQQPLGATSPQRLLRSVPRGAQVKWPLTMRAPEQPGVYDSVWQMAIGGKPFGERLHLAVVVVPEGSDTNLIEMLSAMIADARQQLQDRFEAAWEDLKRRIEARIKEEIEREVQRRVNALCGTAPAGLVIAAGVVWRRRRQQARRS